MNQPRPPNDFDHIARRGLLLSNTLNVYYFYSEPQIDHLRQVEKIKKKNKKRGRKTEQLFEEKSLMEPKKEIFWRFFFFSRPRWELALHRWFPLFFFLLLLISKNINSIFSFRPFFFWGEWGSFFCLFKVKFFIERFKSSVSIVKSLNRK